MTSESRPIQRPPYAKLLVINLHGQLNHLPRRRFVELLRPRDLVVANDAATLPASLRGEHRPSGKAIEVRLAGLSRHGRPIQYAQVPTSVARWDVWTPLAGPAVAFEPPSAGFALDWQTLAAIRARGIAFATITHAAGISSTGDERLDWDLPFAEAYRIPETAALAITRTKAD